MYRSSLDAVKKIIGQAVSGSFPFYVEALPAEPSLPAFYLEHMTSGAETAGGSTVQFQIQWRIIYLTPLRADGTPDGLAQLEVADQLREAFMREPVLEAPDGTLFRMEAFTGGAGETGMFLAVTLSAQYTPVSTTPQVPIMREVHWKGL
ncbi:hypothetical protein D3C75_882120 [compost metagenome]